ncbi:prolipoprotein diacylglyceryl transferase [Sphingomonas kyungheensis]|uniref:Phosphatidylglycerol--prolipoprotein diacylglyceryl transferase n=1 Tax=Sphingomonas kyungheensis TaxID=1069987 RepID=A0ABU8H556_9SPHN
MILPSLAAAVPAALPAAGGHIRFADLGLHPDVFSIGFFTLRWYSLAYIAGILVGWWYLLKLLAQPGAPMARRHADDLVFYTTLGIILGGRIGYVLFYAPEMILHPIRILRLWDGGMSFHGGVIGTSIGIILFARKHKLDWLRVHDYIACVVPFGLFFGRLANFVNGELWGKPADVPWAIVFERTVPFDVPEPARHPSQLYEAGLEGIVLFAILWFAFWRTKARYQPGKLVGLFVLGYGIARFIVEFFREPDAQFRGSWVEATGIHMGQWLCLPMIAGGLYLVLTAPGRRTRVEPIAGTESVA